MRRELLFITFVSALFAATCAAADNSGLYVGVSGGRSKAKNNVTTASQIDAQNAIDGLISNSSIDTTGRVWELYTGYEFFKYFAVEGSYIDLGKVTADSTVTVSPSGIGTRVQHADSKAAGLAVVGMLPLPYHFELFGKGGVQHWESVWRETTTLTNLLVVTSSGTTIKKKGTNLFYGLGLDYKFTDNFAVRGQWERYANIGDNNLITKSDIDVWTVGAKFSF